MIPENLPYKFSSLSSDAISASAHVSGGAKNAVNAEKLNFSSARVER